MSDQIHDPRLEEWQNRALNMSESDRRYYADAMRAVAEMVLRSACIGCLMVSHECPYRCARFRSAQEGFED